MMGRLAVAVVQGGPSSEAAVSRVSAAAVTRALTAADHRVVCLELDAFLPESLRTGGYDVVFPVAHGAVGEDGSLQGLLEVLELPYVGSGVLASALAMNKPVARMIFAQVGLPVARGIVLGHRQFAGDARAAAARARAELGRAVVVKPSSHGSAVGVSRCEAERTDEEVARAIDECWAIDPLVLVEAFARGREATCGVLDLEAAVALPPTEIRAPADAFYDFRARYSLGRSVHLCPAPWDPGLRLQVQRLAVQAHQALGCRDLSRVDFVVGDDGTITILEVNSLPGMTPTSLFPEAARAHGVPLPQLCDDLVLRAHRRGPTRRVAPRPLPDPEPTPTGQGSA